MGQNCEINAPEEQIPVRQCAAFDLGKRPRMPDPMTAKVRPPLFRVASCAAVLIPAASPETTVTSRSTRRRAIFAAF